MHANAAIFVKKSDGQEHTAERSFLFFLVAAESQLSGLGFGFGKELCWGIEREMEVEDQVRVPLLGGKVPQNENGAPVPRRRNSGISLRREFLSRLPEKVRRSVDPETPYHIDLSRTKGLIKGDSCEISLFGILL